MSRKGLQYLGPVSLVRFPSEFSRELSLLLAEKDDFLVETCRHVAVGPSLGCTVALHRVGWPGG